MSQPPDADGPLPDALLIDESLPVEPTWMERLLADSVPNPDAVRGWLDRLRVDGDTPDSLSRRAADRIVWQQATQGAALALPGAIPGIGTAAIIAAEVGAIGAETGLMLRNHVWLSSAVAAAHALPVDAELRRRETIIVLGLWSGAVTASPEKTSASFAKKQLKKLPQKAVKKIAMLVGKKLVHKVGIKRGAALIGKAVPFGIGAVVGGGFAWWLMRGLADASIGYYSDGGTASIEVSS